jgi:hypothetical protein
LEIKSFELSPEALRTCHQIYDEASEALYRLNTFFILCEDMHHPVNSILIRPSSGPPITQLADLSDSCCPFYPKWEPDNDKGFAKAVPSPLTSYLYREHSIDNGPYFKDMPAVAKVRHWRVIVDTDSWFTSSFAVIKPFTHFCRSICKFSPSSLRILAVPEEIPLHQLIGLEVQEVEKETVLVENFKNLKLFRELKHFEMTDAKRCDAPTGFSFQGFSTAAKVSLWFDSHLKWDWKDGVCGSPAPPGVKVLPLIRSR